MQIQRQKPASITRAKIWASHLHAARHCVAAGHLTEAGDHLVDAMKLASAQRWRHMERDRELSHTWGQRFFFATDCYAVLCEMMRKGIEEAA